MKKLKLIIRREFLAKVRNKSFIMMTFLSPLLMVGIGFLVFYLSKKNDEKVKEIVYVDEYKLFAKEDFKDSKTVHYLDYTALGIDEAKAKVEAGNYYGVLYLPKKDSLETLANAIEFYSKDSPSMSMIGDLENKVEAKLRHLKLDQLGIDSENLKASRIATDITLSNFSGDESSKLINGLPIARGVIAGYLLLMSVLHYGTSVMRSVIEEKPVDYCTIVSL